MEEITTRNDYEQAYRLHNEIMAAGNTAASALLDLCKKLKAMRDLKLYKALGQETFDDYCTDMVGIHSRQAYNYISVYEKYGDTNLQSNANLGVSKLLLLSQLPPDERQQMLEDPQTTEMTVAEIKELVEKAKKQGEQLSFFESELEKANEKTNELQEELNGLKANASPIVDEDKLRCEIEKEFEVELEKANDDALKAYEKAEQLQEELNELKNAPTVDEDKLRREIEKEVKAKQESNVNKKVEEELKKRTADIEKAAAEKATAKMKEDNERLKSLLEKNTAESDDLRKKLNMSDSKQTTVNIYFESFKNSFQNLLSAVNQLDAEQQQKYKTAISQAFDTFKSAVQ